MTDTGRTVFGSTGDSDGLAFDNAAGSALLDTGDGSISFAGGPGMRGLADWPSQETGIDVSGTDATFGAWDDFSNGTTYDFELTEAGLYLMQGKVQWSGPGSALERRCRFYAGGSDRSPWAFDAYDGTRLSHVTPCAAGANIGFEFESANTGDSAASVHILIRRLLAGAWN
jgi:hypothetical protein